MNQLPSAIAQLDTCALRARHKQPDIEPQGCCLPDNGKSEDIATSYPPNTGTRALNCSICRGPNCITHSCLLCQKKIGNLTHIIPAEHSTACIIAPLPVITITLQFGLSITRKIGPNKSELLYSYKRTCGESLTATHTFYNQISMN